MLKVTGIILALSATTLRLTGSGSNQMGSYWKELGLTGNMLEGTGLHSQILGTKVRVNESNWNHVEHNWVILAGTWSTQGHLWIILGGIGLVLGVSESDWEHTLHSIPNTGHNWEHVGSKWHHTGTDWVDPRSNWNHAGGSWDHTGRDWKQLGLYWDHTGREDWHVTGIKLELTGITLGLKGSDWIPLWATGSN